MLTIQKKWDSIYQKKTSSPIKPSFVLAHYSHLLPKHGLALDLACGQGGNSFLLAEHGLQVDAWDISPVAINQIKKRQQKHQRISANVVDINSRKIPPQSYDVIVVSRFLERSLIPDLIHALKIDGLMFYQTFTQEKISGSGPSNPLYLLKKGELLNLFSSLVPIIYHDEGLIGDTEQGIRDEALLIAQRLSF